MPVTIYQVDAFTHTPFSGNPAAVCLLKEDKPDTWLQAVAREMNLSETAFLREQDGHFDLRWFTPAYEVDLCGHATLASAHVLWETSQVPRDKEITFSTKSGNLSAIKNDLWIEMIFPIESGESCASPEGLLEALSVNDTDVVDVFKNRMDYLVHLKNQNTLTNLKPDFNSLNNIDTRGIIVTTESDQQKFDFISRFFAPKAGINEDPVTGSAHCFLGPYWAERLAENRLTAYQASERGGVIKVDVGDNYIRLSGQAMLIMRAELYC